MKRLSIAIVLTCMLSISIFAGDIPSLGTPQPERNGSTQTVSSEAANIPSGGAPGDMPTGGAPGEVPMVVSNAALSALLTALGILAV